MKRKIHLINHAHLDPVWLWNWEDGLAESISTFRIAADFCERHKEFIFCHNESLLYRWVERHDPALFKRIGKAVKAGRWHIMGGAYLQPDINMPSGESHIRQFLYGKQYFAKKFNARPRTAWNIDSFGHAEGFVQILLGCGMDHYIFSRPRPSSMDLPLGPFRWRDRSGAEVLAERYDGSYNTRGNVKDKINDQMNADYKYTDQLLLWGYGDHGGGASKAEYKILSDVMKKHPELIHSTPDTYFDQFKKKRDELPLIESELQRASPGCYTSMTRVKHAHREAEGMMAAAERMAAIAWWRKLSKYPKDQLDQAWREIMYGEIHDILTGTCIPTAEKDTLSLFGLCRENIKRVRASVLLDSVMQEPAAKKHVVPVFVFNPHGFTVNTDLEFSFSHSHRSEKKDIITFDATLNGESMQVQRERGQFNADHDWNMQACGNVTLAPFSTKRIDVAWKRRETPVAQKHPKATAERLSFKSKHIKIIINPKTGLVDWAGPAKSRKSYLAPKSLSPAAFRDVSHSWMCGSPDNLPYTWTGEMGKQITPPWNDPDSLFKLATRAQAAEICSPPGGRKAVDPIRIIEDGIVRTIVEAIFVYGRSAIIRHYVFSKNTSLFEIRDRVIWNERGLMLKLQVPLGFTPSETVGETPYCAIRRPVPEHHVEQSNQRWVKAVEDKGDRWVGVVNTSSYGHGVKDNSLFVNVLRSPLYGSSCWPAEKPDEEDRYVLRQDQGEHEIRFGLIFGQGESDMPLVEAAGVMNTRPVWLSFHPAGSSRKVTTAPPAVEATSSNVEVVALKQAENGRELVIRLMEHEGRKTNCDLILRSPSGRKKISIGAYQLKTILVRQTKKGLVFRETNLVEERIK